MGTRQALETRILGQPREGGREEGRKGGRDGLVVVAGVPCFPSPSSPLHPSLPPSLPPPYLKAKVYLEPSFSNSAITQSEMPGEGRDGGRKEEVNVWMGGRKEGREGRREAKKEKAVITPCTGRKEGGREGGKEGRRARRLTGDALG